MNRAVLVGRLTKDPELRYTQSGIAVVSFTLAVDRRKGQDGQKETDFLPIVVWRQLAELCANYLKKGQQAAVEGRIQTRSYDGNDGQKRYVTEIVADSVDFLGGGSNEQSQNSGQGFQNQNPFQQQNNNFPPQNQGQFPSPNQQWGSQNQNQFQNPWQYQQPQQRPQNNQQSYQGGNGRGNQGKGQQSQNPFNFFSNQNAPIDISDDDLPF